MARTDVEIFIGEKIDIKRFLLPDALKICDENGSIYLKLTSDFIQKENMQVSGNAFEGWACVIHVVWPDKNVYLDVDDYNTLSSNRYLLNGRIKPIEKENKESKYGHICRFLYRAKRFSEQYSSWFKLSDELKTRVDDFFNYLNAQKPFVNNSPTKEATNNNFKIDDENAVEAACAKGNTLQSILKVVDIGPKEVYRQLPVGLFEGEKGKDKAVFTIGHSAIDLWNINDDTLNIVELKTGNRMIGIITEIFFYSNYMFDFLCGENNIFKLAEPDKLSKEYLRGYDTLYNAKSNIQKVNGIMLVDEEAGFHPCVERCWKVLTENGRDDLKYFIAKYQLITTIKQSKQEE